MRITEKRKQEIVQAFQASFKRDNAPDIEAIPLVEMRQADEMIGDRDLNSGYRIALRNKIREIEEKEQQSSQRTYENKIRAWNLFVGIIAGVVIAVIGDWLTN
jgi:hypothetical protein